ncbi:MFS transporter [Saccharopolyspora sp. WRP15-2]|uniref:MFS transporter n=1 Tax=Saccharopolyspora oryzae TaxID=2997343 RepID=A0ABT4V439_9PSEU|nr:MFS transporter [Saccharopolyspora oryzae]MDA3628736.1 MFS transporter [Saccharopolyspora oryzae]
MNRPDLSVVERAGGASLPAALALTSLSTFAAMLAYSGPLGNAATITTALGAASGTTMWILSAMSTGLAVSLLPAGALADQLGRRKVFELGACVFAIGSAVCATATTATQFVIGRLVAGAGAAGVIATGLGLVAAVNSGPGARSAAASWWGASMGLGIALGPLLTGAFDLADLWRAPYWLLAAAGVGIAAAARRCYPETAADPDRSLDLVGAALLTTGLGLLLVALIEARRGGLALALACAGGAVIALLAFAISQLRSRSPMVEFALFRRGDFAAATVAAAITGAGVIALMSFACTFLVTSMGMSTFAAGAAMGLWSGSSAVSAVLSRRLVARLTGTVQLAIGLAATGAGLLLLAGLEPGASVARLVPGLLVAGVATGVLNAGLGRQATATVPPERAAVGVGMNNTTRYLGASIGVAVIGVVASAPRGDIVAQMSGWNHVAVLAGAVSLFGAAAVLVLPRLGTSG